MVRSKVSTNKTVVVVFMSSGLKFKQIKLWWWFSCGQVKHEIHLEISLFIFSVGTLWDRPWVWNTAHCWYNYPFHPLGNPKTYFIHNSNLFIFEDPAVWWHYMLEMAFYWSLFFTQFFDVKRKVL